MDVETRYSAIEKLCLCLYFFCTKLRHYLLSVECTIICKDDVVKYMLSMPILSGRMSKRILALSEFDLRYDSAKAVKGQVMADLVTQQCNSMSCNTLGVKHALSLIKLHISILIKHSMSISSYEHSDIRLSVILCA